MTELTSALTQAVQPGAVGVAARRRDPDVARTMKHYVSNAYKALRAKSILDGLT
jgi:hypothetical protein